ncbi:MAG: transporter [Rikenellaceae bacterium]
MKRRLSIALLATVAATLISTNTEAQTYGGWVLDHDIMMPTDFAMLSQTQVFGTSRSMAMGGAFTSLGADLSSSVINPAGLGMYAHETLSFTPKLSIANSLNSGVPSWIGNSKTNFGFSNLGASFKLVENGKGSLIALNGAITYNRLADYNTRTSFSSESLYDPTTDDLVPSIADIFIGQLAGAEIFPDSEGGMSYDNNPYFWPAQSAYKTYLIDPLSGNSGWGTNTIGHNASVLSSMEMVQRGRADEYSFAIGGNVGNFLYFGATLGLQDINQVTEYTYQEEYNYYSDEGYAYGSAADLDPLDYQASYTNIWQKTAISGVGYNLKLGLIARPTRSLRIGVALHSPTYYSLARTYETSTATNILGNASGLTPSEEFWVSSPQFIDNYEYSWNFRTPPKLLVGTSLQVGAIGIISLDYERQWYNSIRVSNAPGELTTEDYKASYKGAYQPTNTFRLGIEVKPLPLVALRAGGGVSSSMVKDETLFYSSPVATDSSYITCGLGFQLSATTTLDLAYQYHHQNYSPYYLFFTETAADNSSVLRGSNLFETSMDRSFITATLTFRM